MKKIVIFLCFLFALSLSCAPSRSTLKQISLGITKEEVIKVMGDPSAVRVSIINKFGQAVEILEYRVLKKGKALDIARWDTSPYWFYIVDRKLVRWGNPPRDWRNEAERVYETKFGNEKPPSEN